MTNDPLIIVLFYFCPLLNNMFVLYVHFPFLDIQYIVMYVAAADIITSNLTVILILLSFCFTGSLTALVCQHSITPLALPCKLIIPDRGKCSTPNFTEEDYGQNGQ